MPRVSSRPSAEAAERANDRNAEEPSTLPTTSSSGGSSARRRRGDGSGISGHGFGSSGSGAGTGAGAGAGGGGGASRAASRSYAESRSTGCPYLTHSGEPATAAERTAGSTGAMSERGARSIVQATGVGD